MALELLIPVALFFGAPGLNGVDAQCGGSCGKAELGISLLRPDGLTSRSVIEKPLTPTKKAGLRPLVVPAVLNGNVRVYVESFQGSGRSLYARWYARMGRYRALMQPILDRYDLPGELLYLCMVESGFNPDAVSRASAVGLWQFIQGTARAYGLRWDDWVDERRDPVKSTDAAARHLRDLYNALGSWPLAFAGYNAGLGGVKGAIRRGNSNDFWRLVALRELPSEASRYVPKIMAAMLVGENPEIFGMEGLPSGEPLRFDTVQTPGGIDLQALAAGSRVSFKELLSLNPELLRGYTPPYGVDYPLRTPLGSGSRISKWLDRREDSRPDVFIDYTVRFGERMKHIAQERGVSERRIRRANQFMTGEPRPGGSIIIPHRRDRKPRIEGLWVFQDPELSFPSLGRKAVYFPVRWKLDLRAVAAAFQVSAGQVAMWNGLDALAPVQRGMVLRLYVEPDFDSAGVVMIDPARVTVVKPGSNAAENALAHAAAGRAATVKRIRHKIRRGESLWSISKKYGVTVASIKAENGFGRGRGLKPGRTIVVPRDVAPKPKGKAARRKAKPGIRGKRYRVKPGDSLWKISRRFGVPLLKLKKKNKMGKRSRLKPGQTLFIPR